MAMLAQAARWMMFLSFKINCLNISSFMKRIVLLFQLVCFSVFSQVIKTKTIENGGSGPYKAIAASQKSLPTFTVYRPDNIKSAVASGGKLPVMVFGNGACANTSISHENLLSEVASNGYVIIAIGPLKMENSPEWESTEAKLLIDALDWIEVQAKDKKSDYYENVDLDNIASAGQSCGGAQVMATANDERLKTYIMFNSGMGDMDMAGANPESKRLLHGPILYVVGGEKDIASDNAQLDYERINHVPIAFTNMLDGDHGGTFDDQYGGSFAKIALKWLDWQLKGDEQQASVFLENDISSFPGWSIETKNFKN